MEIIGIFKLHIEKIPECFLMYRMNGKQLRIKITAKQFTEFQKSGIPII